MINDLYARGVFALALLAAGLVGILAVTPAANAQGKWRLGPPIPQGANEVIGAAIEGQILVYGGQDSGSNAMGIFWKFDRGKNDWSTLPSNPVPVHHGASASIGRKFYLFGGFRLPDTGKAGWYPENKAWVFDLDSQKWSVLPPMPTARGALAATAVGKKVYVSGGAGIPQDIELPDGLVGGGPVELYGTLEVFDTESNAWSKLASMPTPRNHHSIAAVDGKVYAIGGRVGSCYSGGWSSNVWMNEAYDIAANTWAMRAPMPTARSGTGTAALAGRIYVLGGESWVDDFGGVFRANEVYDPNANIWSRAARMITPRHGFAVAQVGNSIYAISGANNAGGAGTLSVVAVNEIYEP
jgi:N-acetylneuraminic acid mutarotase